MDGYGLSDTAWANQGEGRELCPAVNGTTRMLAEMMKSSAMINASRNRQEGVALERSGAEPSQARAVHSVSFLNIFF